MSDINENRRSTDNKIHALPTGVIPVKTAVPVFVGYTERRADNESGISIRLISSVEEYESLFGKTSLCAVLIKIKQSQNFGDNATDSNDAEISCEVPFIAKMWYHIQMYFANGGGSCYIISVGNTSKEKFEVEELLAGIEKAGGCEDATILVCPQVEDMEENDAAKVYQEILNQCGELMNRFAILDCFDNNNSFRVKDTVGSRYLSYGAVYHPYLKTTFPVLHDETSLQVEYYGQKETAKKKLFFSDLTDSLKEKVRKKLKETTVVLPPSSAIAAVYVHNDAVKNVWTAPADIVLKSVISPTIELDEKDQSVHIADAVTGKSINVIRAIPQKGSVVIGARTLLAKDDKWRYISMRRTFMMIENSLKKFVKEFAQEKNDISTWVRIQLAAENFLMSLLYRGVLQGAKPDHSYSVKIGLGESMTEEDISDGNMILEVGVAMIIPSDFIFLRIVQKMEEKNL